MKNHVFVLTVKDCLLWAQAVFLAKACCEMLSLCDIDSYRISSACENDLQQFYSLATSNVKHDNPGRLLADET
jgi:hypothetical protein